MERLIFLPQIRAAIIGCAYLYCRKNNIGEAKALTFIKDTEQRLQEILSYTQEINCPWYIKVACFITNK